VGGGSRRKAHGPAVACWAMLAVKKFGWDMNLIP